MVSKSRFFRYTFIICINHSLHHRIIVPALEIIHIQFGVIIITAIANWVQCADFGILCIGDIEDFTPTIIGVFRNSLTGSIDNADHIALRDILMLHAVYRLAIAHAIHIIMIRDRLAVALGCCKIMCIFPREFPCCAIVIAQRIAYSIIRNRSAIVTGQQVFPIRIRIFIRVRCGLLRFGIGCFDLSNIARCIVSICVFQILLWQLF